SRWSGRFTAASISFVPARRRAVPRSSNLAATQGAWRASAQIRGPDWGPCFAEGRLMKRAMPGVEQTSPDPNPPHGEKGGFRKITMTLPQWAYQQLIQESAR